LVGNNVVSRSGAVAFDFGEEGRGCEGETLVYQKKKRKKKEKRLE